PDREPILPFCLHKYKRFRRAAPPPERPSSVLFPVRRSAPRKQDSRSSSDTPLLGYPDKDGGSALSALPWTGDSPFSFLLPALPALSPDQGEIPPGRGNTLLPVLRRTGS